MAFVQHLLPLQPFLSLRQIEQLMENFAHLYGDQQRGGRSCDERKIPHNNNLKRKLDVYTQEQLPQRPRVQCSPNNAIAFLILALGDTTLKSRAEIKSNDTTYLASGQEFPETAPGVSYYARAMHLMAGHLDGDDLVHAQMFLLAGLYKAQLGRIQEASSWYFMAGRVLLRLLDRHDLTTEQYAPKLKSGTKCSRYALTYHEQAIVLAAWACLHFESEVIPELRLPLSGLERVKQHLPLPEPYRAETAPNAMRPNPGNVSSLANLETARLRKIVSVANQQTSATDCAKLWPEQVRVVMKGHTASLQDWRSSLPEQLRWNDQDPLPDCNVIAAFRRSYWQAKIFLLRPYLYYALHILPDVRHSSTASLSTDIHQQGSAGLDAHTLAAVHVTTKKAGESEILRLADLCLEAAKHSITAYNGVKGKVIFTNAQDATHRYVIGLLL